MHTHKIEVCGLNLWYAQRQALGNIELALAGHCVTALIGPSGCGKTSLLRCLNRMNDLVPRLRLSGKVYLDGHNIYAPGTDVVDLRRRVGMVFQSPNPFPRSIYDNIAYAPRVHGLISNRGEQDDLVEHSLRRAGLWDEVADRLQHSGMSLSQGQQQRLCIARAIAVAPEVILMDEPSASLDPISTALVEELIVGLKSEYTLVIVTHNLQQAARVADAVAFFDHGELVEFNDTDTMFTNPKMERTEAYITGRYG